MYDFLEALFEDLLPRLEPLTSYFHLGGDEVNKNAYNLDDTVRSNESAVLQPLMQKFMDRNMKQVTEAGFTPLVWEEMLLDWNLTLPASTIVQSWQSDANVATIASKGYRVIAGNYNYWYLDCGSGQWLDFRPGASSENFWPYSDYCFPRHNCASCTRTTRSPASPPTKPTSSSAARRISGRSRRIALILIAWFGRGLARLRRFFGAVRRMGRGGIGVRLRRVRG